MKPERYNLLYFFRELIQLSIKYPGPPGWGHACSELLDTLILKQDHFINRIMIDDSGDFHEYRLNGAGLKMQWRVNKEGDSSKFQCYISGDQKKEYDDFVVMAEKHILERGVNHR